jgi:four helix bundle protein
MNIVGDAILELASRLWIQRIRRMGKKEWCQGIDVRRLTGEQWLRLLTGETNMGGFVGWCTKCRTGKCRETTCLHCGTALLLFDEPFWCRTGHKIRVALQKDRTLLARVKSERESLYRHRCHPMLPAPLEWLLKAWEHAHAFALAVFKATEGWPKREWYGIAAQIRRSAYSVPANIAEGAAKRSRKEFRRYLDIAIGSLDETHYGLRIAHDLGFLDAEAANRLEGLRAEASKCLWGLARSITEQ